MFNVIQMPIYFLLVTLQLIIFEFTTGDQLCAILHQGRSQEFATGDKRGVWRMEVPQKLETNANFQLRRGDMHPCPPWLRHCAPFW